jgi:type III secretion protein V
MSSANSYLYSRLGIELPSIFITQGNLPEGTYQILINEVVNAEAKLFDDLVLVPSSEVTTIFAEDQLLANEINIGQMELGYWVANSAIQQLEDLGFNYLTPESFLLEHVTECLISSIQDLIGFQEIKTLLDKMSDYQDLIKELLRMLPLNKITDIIKRLVSERIPIRNFKVILDKLLEWAPKESETILLVEYVRLGLAKYIGQMHKVNGKIYSVLIDSDVEELITEAMRYTSNGFYLDLSDSFYDEFNEKLHSIIESLKLKNKIVVVTKMNIRKAVSHIVRQRFNIAVLSIEEVQASGVEMEAFEFIYL